MSVQTVLNKEQIFQLLKNHAKEVQAFGVFKLGLFGSIVRGEQNDKSDIDFLVEFNEGQKNYDNFIHLVFFLEDIFQKEVDLVTRKSLSDRLKKIIDKEIEYVSFNS
ncbi:MAG TPA: nucleotidyltransferase family protein [Balneolaceae bacterium]|nr:nucleotidyltransferase family protein [Balneolaceae bacterium]